MTVFHEVSMLILTASTICILPQTSQELVDDPTGIASKSFCRAVILPDRYCKYINISHSVELIDDSIGTASKSFFRADR